MERRSDWSSGSPESVTEMGLWEANANKTDDFRWILERLAARRLENSARYHEYRDFFLQFFASDFGNPTTLSLGDLDHAQKWLLLFMYDMFLHNEICFPRRTDDASSEWLAFWNKQSAWALPVYHSIKQSPDVIDGPQLEEIWRRFSAALF